MMDKLLIALLYSLVALVVGVIVAFGLELFLLLRLIIREL